MGIQDREWYQAELQKKSSQYKQRPPQSTEQTDAPIPITRPAKQNGAHWVVKLLFWITILTVLLIAFKQLR